VLVAHESLEPLVALLVIAAATVLVYSNTFDAPFHFDDFPNIVENARLRNLVDMWPPSGGRYLGYLSFSLNYQLAGLRVFGFHATNLLIHLCNGALVFWLTSLTLRTPSVQAMEASPLIRRYLPLTAALLFALHPVQTQAVTFIVQRFTSLATLFYLLSVALFVRARLQPPRGPSPRGRVGLPVLRRHRRGGGSDEHEGDRLHAAARRGRVRASVLRFPEAPRVAGTPGPGRRCSSSSG